MVTLGFVGLGVKLLDAPGCLTRRWVNGASHTGPCSIAAHSSISSTQDPGPLHNWSLVKIRLKRKLHVSQTQQTQRKQGKPGQPVLGAVVLSFQFRFL